MTEQVGSAFLDNCKDLVEETSGVEDSGKGNGKESKCCEVCEKIKKLLETLD